MMENPWITFEGNIGPGKGKHIVFLAGDEEYRSEEGLPQLAKILSQRHGFKCTVLFSQNEKGEIDPNVQDNQPGMANLAKADLCIMLLRFRKWPDSQMAHFSKYFLDGKPIIALRTSTHAFDYPADSPSSFKKFGWRSSEWQGGFGKQVLGENWVSHWGNHGTQATRGVIVKSAHPIVKGVVEVFGPSDVYEAAPPVDATILVEGEVVEGMKSTDAKAEGSKKTSQGVSQGVNEPRMPILWTRNYSNENGTKNKIVTCTMGASTDLLSEGLRRLIVNSVYWSLGLESKISDTTDVRLVGTYQPTNFGFNKFKVGVIPASLQTLE